MWWFACGLALGNPVIGDDQRISEEVTVYSNPLAPWDNTRWLVKLQTASRSETLSVEGERGSFSTWIWQVSAVIRCNVLKRKPRGGLVECSPESVSIRVVTGDKWQRQEDREQVEDVVDDVRATMVQGSVRLRVLDHGSLRVLPNQLDTGESNVAATLLRRIFDGFQLDLPEEGFRDGVSWSSTSEPLLVLRTGIESYGAEQVVHVGSVYRGQQIVQSRGRARKQTVVGHTGKQPGPPRMGSAAAFDASYNPGDEMAISTPREIVRRSEINMDAVAVLDADKGFVTERIWDVRGYFLRRLGRLQFLEEAEHPDLGMSGQVSPPDQQRLHLPAWSALER